MAQKTAFVEKSDQIMSIEMISRSAEHFVSFSQKIID